MLLSYHNDDPAFVEAFRPGSIGTASFAHGIRVGDTHTSHLLPSPTRIEFCVDDRNGISPQQSRTHCSVVHSKQCFTGIVPPVHETKKPLLFLDGFLEGGPFTRHRVARFDINSMTSSAEPSFLVTEFFRCSGQDRRRRGRSI